MYRNERNADAHGEVIIAVRSELESVNVKSSSTIELISGAVKLSKNKNLVVVSFYRPPNMVEEQYLSVAFTEFTDLRKQYKNS